MSAKLAFVCCIGLIACDSSKGASRPWGSSASAGSAGARGGDFSTGGAPNINVPAAAAAGAANDEACVTYRAKAVLEPAVLELVVDISRSMAWPPGFDDPLGKPPSGTSRWESTRSALLSAVAQLPANAGLGVYFYPGIKEDDVGTCIRYADALPLARLGASGSKTRAAFEEAVAAVTPYGGTPTHAAYGHGLKQLESTRLSGNKFLLLITDGSPTYTKSCKGDGRKQVDSAPLLVDVEKALAAKVRTFVVGSPGSEEARTTLSQMASKGGTARPSCKDTGPDFCHFDMTAQQNLGQALTRVLTDIAGTISSCNYAIPTPPAGQTIDTAKVNVAYTPSTGPRVSILQAANPRACTDGWRYSDDNTRVELCGRACDKLRADPKARVEILFGCLTKIESPK